MSINRKERLIARLLRARRTLLAEIDGLTADQWASAVYSDGAMSRVIDVVNHLADAESGMLRNLQNIVAGGEGVPADFDRDRYNDSRLRKTSARTPADLRSLLEENRKQLLAFVDGLDEADLDRQGRHAALEILPVENHLKIIAIHELSHARDIRLALQARG